MKALAGALLLIAMAVGQFGFHLNETGSGLLVLVLFGVLGGGLVGTSLARRS
jgi:hypothetical protein